MKYAYKYAVTFLFLVPTVTFARSGCCSHHGGVCGCGCCDGTALSATCAPYYPECNSDYSNTDTANDSYASYSQAPAIPTCPSHSTYNTSQNQCVCDYGYVPTTNQNGCVLKPPVVAAPVRIISSKPQQTFSSSTSQQSIVSSTASSIYQLPTPIDEQPTSAKQSSDSPVGTLLGASILGGGGYYWYRKRKKVIK